MKSLIISYILIAVNVINASDYKSQRKNDRYMDTYIFRKGGVPQKTKNMNAQYIIHSLYIAPAVMNRTRMSTGLDLLNSYTICEKPLKEFNENISSRLYSFILCPDEIMTLTNFNEYCCFRNSTHCCNYIEFMNSIPIRKESPTLLSSLFSFIGLLFFVIIVVTLVKLLCGSRLRSRFNNMIIFRRRGGPSTNPNYQQAMPLVYPPTEPFVQYPAYQPVGPTGTVQYTYGSPPLPGQCGAGYVAQYPPGPATQVTGQYSMSPPQGLGPPGHQLHQNVSPMPQPPPDYEKAILQ